MDKISVIIPVYFNADVLKETHSVLSETLRAHSQKFDYELIFVDDGSKDNSVEIIEQYVHRYPEKIIFIGQKNQGQTKALNTALEHVTGDIIGWINSDDYYHAGAFSTIIKIFEANPDIDIVFGDYDLIDVDGKLIKHERQFDVDQRMGKILGFGNIVASNTISFL